MVLDIASFSLNKDVMPFSRRWPHLLPDQVQLWGGGVAQASMKRLVLEYFPLCPIKHTLYISSGVLSENPVVRDR